MQTVGLEGKEIAIVAMGESQLDFHLSLIHSNKYDEVWAINAMAGIIKEVDRVFMLDPASRFLDTDDAGTQTDIMRKVLPTHPGPIFTCELDDRVPGAVLYPLTEVVEATDCAYFNNTIPYAIAYAMYRKVKAINLFGIDFTYKGNLHFAEEGKACVEFWLSKCISAGIDIKIAPRSSLLDTDKPLSEKLYGYHRLDDPIVVGHSQGQGFKTMKVSEYEALQKELQLQKVREVGTVIEVPEAKRY